HHLSQLMADGRGQAALIWASKEGHDSVVKLLLQAEGVDGNSKDSQYGQTALLWASANGHESVVKLLLQMDGTDINFKDDDSRTALSYALIDDNALTAQLLLKAGAIDGRENSIPANPVQLDTLTADRTAE
ncbi:ankyrin repeat-containing domain protein, partial [Pyronema domesticum]